MSFDADAEYARRLQAEFDLEDAGTSSSTQARAAEKRKHDDNDVDLNSTANIVHPDWETLDPTPDISTLFSGFNMKFFQNRLECVELEWSKRMFQCAGICYQRRNQLGRSVIIRLSQPLLKLRPRRDLIQTLLHEMIHAYLFVLNIREANGGHGPNFKRLMESINKVAGTNITVYHTFNDEVDHYKTHVWRCNGICQHRKPFFGFVKRTSNRAPGPNDLWWAKHRETCSGTFVKIAAPEPKEKIGRSAKVAKTDPKMASVRNWVMPISPNKRFLKKTDAKPATATKAGTPARIIPDDFIVLRDLNPIDFPALDKPGGSKDDLIGNLYSPNVHSDEVRRTVRRHWLSRGVYGDAGKKSGQPKEEPVPLVDPDDYMSQPTVSLTKPENDWRQFDDGLFMRTHEPPIIHIDDEPSVESMDPNLQPNRDHDFTQRMMEHLTETNDTRHGVIELIDDEYDNLLGGETLEILSDTSVIDEMFGSDTLLDDFNSINNVIMQDPENRGNSDKEIVACPICGDRMSREDWTEHLDGCEGFRFKVSAHTKVTTKDNIFHVKPKVTVGRDPELGLSLRDLEMFQKAGYGRDIVRDLMNVARSNKRLEGRVVRVDEDGKKSTSESTAGSTSESAAESASESAAESAADSTPSEAPTIDLDGELRDNRLGEVVYREPDRLTECPVCNETLALAHMNDHLDECLLYHEAPDLRRMKSVLGSRFPE